MLAFVFPILLLTYIAARSWMAWRYGSFIRDENGYVYPLHRVLLSTAGPLAVALAVVTAWIYFTNANSVTNANAVQLALLAGIAAVLALAGSLIAMRRRMRERGRHE